MGSAWQAVSLEYGAGRRYCTDVGPKKRTSGREVRRIVRSVVSSKPPVVTSLRFRFFGKLAGIWKSLHAEEKDSSPEADASATATAPEIIGKSRFRMTVTRTMTTVPKPQAATSDKGEEVQSDDVTFADEAERKTARVPEEKFDEVFSNIPPEEVEYGEGEPEEETPDRRQASGSSFDEIEKAVKTARNPDATRTEREQAAKVFVEMEGTELYDMLMEGSTEMSVRIKGLIEIRLKEQEVEFLVPDNIDEFDIRKYATTTKKE